MLNVIEDIKDADPPIDLPPDLWWLWFVLALAVVIALLSYLYYRRTQFQSKFLASPEPVLSPGALADQQINALRQKDLLAQGKYKEFYTEVSLITRTYMENRFNIRAPHMSTEEFLQHLHGLPLLNDVQQQTLKDFLFSCDMVKFAQYEPSALEARAHIDLAQRLVDDTRI